MPATSAFDEALSRFKKELTPQEIATFTATSIQDCWAEAKKIEDNQAKRRSLRYMRRIEPYLNALTQFSGVIQVFVQAKPEVMSFIWGPIKFLIQIASTYTASLDKLLDAFVKISENLPRFVNYADIFQKNPHMIHVISLIYEDILIFHRSTMKFFRRKAWKQIFTPLWRTFEDSFGMILKNLECHKNLVDNEATAAHIAAANEERQAAICADRRNQKDRHIRQMRELKEWLAPVFYEAEKTSFANIRNSCPGTGDWLLENDKFKVWLDPNSHIPFLWLTGIPGSGKTILASLVADHTKLLPQGTNSTVFAYLKSGNCGSNSCLAIMRTFVYQLLAQNQDLIPYIYQNYESSNFNSPTSLKKIEDILQTMLGNTVVPYFIIDGLDEIEPVEGKSLLSSLLSIQSKNANLKIFLSSRSEVEISKILSSVTQIKIGEANMKDIAMYARKEGQQLTEKFCDLDLETRREIEGIVQRVGDCADGMFLWVRLVIYNLMQQTDLEELEAAAKDLPKGLEEAYGRILQRIDDHLGPNERDRARRILEWVICANRPLELREIEFALTIRVGDKSFVKKRKLLRQLDELCGPILEIHDNGIVDFVHFSAKEYLINDYSGPFIHTPTAHFNVAQTCLSYLLFTCFDINLDHGKIIECIYNGDYRFEGYAERNWLYHVSNANNCTTQQLQDLGNTLEPFIQNRQNLRYQCPPLANQEVAHFSSLRKKCPDIYTSLVMIHNYESQSSQGPLLLDLKDEHPLQLQSAIRRAHEGFETLVLSLSELVDPENVKRLQSIRGLYGPNLFKCHQSGCIQFHMGFETLEYRDKHSRKHICAFKCRVQTCPYHSAGFMTERALEKHHNDHHKEVACIDMEDSSNMPTDIPEISKDPKVLSSLLQDSINTDNVTLLNWVLAQGVDIEAMKVGKHSMFGYALSRGSKSTNTVRALIDNGANIHSVISNRRKRPALIIASSSPSYDISIIQLLTEKGGGLLDLDSHGLSPLIYAIRNRGYAGVEDFLRRVDKNDMTTTLRTACIKKDWDILRYLFDYGATVSPTIAGKVLLDAVEDGRGLEDLNAILGHGVDAESLTAALSMAWDNKLWDISGTLVEHSARTTPDEGGEALLAAIEERRGPKGIKAILDHGTDRRSLAVALSMAWGQGLWVVAQALVEYGARVTPFEGGKALLAAMEERRGSEDLKAILNHGADEGSLTAALSMAWNDRLWDIAKAFVEHGARTTLDEGGEALLVAMEERRGSEDLKAILDHGADEKSLTAALSMAWYNRLWGISGTLVEYGVRIAPDEGGEALLAAMEERRGSEDLKAILDHGTDKRSLGAALSMAWNNRLWDIAKTFLEHGARITPDEGGKALLAAMGERRGSEDLKPILDHGTDKRSLKAALTIAWDNCLWDIAKTLGKYSRGMFYKVGEALLAAMEERRGSGDLKAILNHGTDRRSLGAVLTLAWDNRLWDIAEGLVEHGVRTIPNEGGEALLAAIEERRGPKGIKVILDHGTDRRSLGVALAMAQDNRLWDVSEILIKHGVTPDEGEKASIAAMEDEGL